MRAVTIVGAGVAALALVRELRRHSAQVPIHLLTTDAGDYYYKPRLSNAFARGHTRVELVQGERTALEHSLGIRIDAGRRIESLDIAGHSLSDGRERLRFDQLVLALGARPFRPPIPGLDGSRVHLFNHLDDYTRLHARLAGGRKRVLVIGSGLIGCELGEDLALAGHAVTLTDLAALPLARLVEPALGIQLRDALAQSGVDWALDQQLVQLVDTGSDLHAHFADASPLVVDLAVCVTGVVPNAEMARRDGLATARGIKVDAIQATVDPDIHALGDCAEGPEGWLPFVAPFAHTVPALAATLLGTPTAVHLPPLPIRVKTRSLPLLVLPPPRGVTGEWSAYLPDCHARVFRRSDGRVVGFALVGEALRIKDSLLHEVRAA